jgi:uncharacterized membrane protein HdeD (DUF308 family)
MKLRDTESLCGDIRYVVASVAAGIGGIVFLVNAAKSTHFFLSLIGLGVGVGGILYLFFSKRK